MLKLRLELNFAHFQCAHPQLSWGSCCPSTVLQNKESLCYPCPSSRPAYCLPFKGSTWTALFYSLQHLSWVMPRPVIPMHFVVRESTSKPCGCSLSPAYDGFSGQNTRMGKKIEIGLEPSVLGWSQDAQSKVPWTGEASPLWRFLHRRVCVCVCVRAQSCPTLCYPMDCSPPGASVHGILQERILEKVAISFSRGSSPTQWSNLRLLHLLHWQVDSLFLAPLGKPPSIGRSPYSDCLHCRQ